MSDGLNRFNALPAAEAQRLLYSCFADHAWTARVAAARPFGDLSAMLAAAESSWSALTPADWLAAFGAHPRIGQAGGGSPKHSEGEQSRVMQASEATLAALTAENRTYEESFGHVFLIAARGRSAEEILKALRARMNNTPETELAIAMDEQRKITALRLEQLCES